MLPFTKDVFFRLLARYNADIWPAHIAAVVLGIVVVFLIFKPRRGSDKFIAAVLAGAWIWTGAVYHMMYLTTINWAAWASGALFVCQGGLIAWTGAGRGRIAFRAGSDRPNWFGVSLVALALLAYPLAGPLTELGWSRAPVAGIASGPTTLLTLGLILLAEGRIPVRLLLIPALWTIVAGASAWPLHLPHALILPAAGIVSFSLALIGNRRLPSNAKRE